MRSTSSLIVPFGVQTGVSLGFESRGTVTEETYDANGALLERTTVAVRADVRGPPRDRDRWLNVAVLPLETGG